MSAELAGERPVDDGDASLSLLAHHLRGRTAVSLERVLSVAQLTTRVELKYLVPLAALPAFLHGLPPALMTLDIGGRRIFDYESVYFDTESFALYRNHVQGRRKRYKARIRSYCNSGDAMFEVKLKGRRGQTVKERLPYDFERRRELTREGRLFLDTMLAQAYGFTAPPLRPSLTTAYQRATLVDLEHRSRLTIDVNLSWFDGDNSHHADQVALIESKSLAGPGPSDALLRSMGVRPARISKYCLGVALLHPDLAANPWNRLLISNFDWQRRPSPELQIRSPRRAHTP
jgi:VTC domain-containing protein